MINVHQVYRHVVTECQNGCTDASSAFVWIKRHRPDLVDNLGGPPGIEGRTLLAILQSINFHAVRENRTTLFTAIVC